MYACLIDLIKKYESVDRTLLWKVLSCFGVPELIILVMSLFHDSMRLCVCLDDGECSGRFHVEQSLGQGYWLASHVYKQAHEFLYVGGNVNHDADSSTDLFAVNQRSWSQLKFIFKRGNSYSPVCGEIVLCLTGLI